MTKKKNSKEIVAQYKKELEQYYELLRQCGVEPPHKKHYGEQHDRHAHKD